MTGKLEGKIAVVTGGSKGIGAAIAKTLAAEGARVVVNYASSKPDADAVVEAIKSVGGTAAAVVGDVSNSGDAQNIIDFAIAQYGKLDILVNNAGVYEFSTLSAITEEHFHKVFNINVLGLLLITQAAAKHLCEGGSIINIGATITTMKPVASAVYASSKSAVETITGVLAKELGPRKIRINTISPGPTQTEGASRMADSEMGKALIAQTPLGRLGTPADIARAALFLASDESGWITGDVLLASGGLH
ncbi:SDR family NAD(P)-dependent oxidoreductase [Caballeronia sp. DA-9]|uniref:SDR family NAD(P)-dependent oxidoreductase n=1 Tax=Caballeronia sp. DA-9 TaxID=3436237 RepID=UPI003F66513A